MHKGGDMSRRIKAGIAGLAVAVAAPVAIVLASGPGQPAGPGQAASKSHATQTAALYPVAAPGGAAGKARTSPASSSPLRDQEEDGPQGTE